MRVGIIWLTTFSERVPPSLHQVVDDALDGPRVFSFVRDAIEQDLLLAVESRADLSVQIRHQSIAGKSLTVNSICCDILEWLKGLSPNPSRYQTVAFW